MLLKITEKCSMGCSHCLSDCKPEEKHMTDDTLEKAIKFIKNHSMSLLAVVISGGEPTEHPKFKEYLRKIVTSIPETIQVAVVTNGVWMCEHYDEFVELHKELSYPNSGRLLIWQVTSIPDYYPIDIKEKYPDEYWKLNNMPSVFIENQIQKIYPIGRAKDMDSDYIGPQCFNIRSIATGVESFLDILATLSIHQKSCTPCIEYDGNIKLGESQLCPACSNIDKSDMEILHDIRNFKCMACEVPISKLPERALSILK